MSQAAPRSRGRPPDPAIRRRVLDAAREILTTEGLGRVTIEAVAARSGVSRPTIYRSWSNAHELAMAALMPPPSPTESPGVAGLGPALQRQIRTLTAAFAATRGRQIALTLAASDARSELAQAFRNRVILSSREEGRRLIEEAAARGEIVAPADLEVLLDMIYGPIFYRILARHLPLDREFADALCRTALPMLGLRPA